MTDFLSDLGRLTADPFWLPVLVWSVLALPAILIARLVGRRQASAQRDLHMAVLLALPASIPLSWLVRVVAGDLVPAFPFAAAPVVTVGAGTTGTEMVAQTFSASGPADAFVPSHPDSITLLLGLLTILAILLAIVGVGLLAVGARRLHRIVGSATPLDGWDDPTVDVLTTNAVSVPISCGLVRRRILLPEGHSDRTDVVIAHELLHHELGDVRRTWLAAVIRAVFAFHPLVHVVSARLALLVEMACDRHTLDKTGIGAAAYATILVSNVPSGPSRRLSPVAVPMGRSHRELRDRIRAIGSARGRSVSVHPGILVFVIALFSALLTAASVERAPVLVDATQPVATVADTAAVSGRVIWRQNRQPAVGAAVQVEGTEIGAATDRSGRFVIVDVPPGEQTLVVSFVGAEPVRKTVVVPVEGSVAVDFELGPAAGSGEDEIYVIVEDMPELVGGLEGLQKKIRYPDIARRAGIEGRVIVQFIVDERGRVVDPGIVRGVGAGLDEEAMRLVSQAEFRPGRQRGEPVKVKMSLPIAFRLGDIDGANVVRIEIDADGALFLDGRPTDLTAIERLGDRDLSDTVVTLVVDDGAPSGRVMEVQTALRNASATNIRYGRLPGATTRREPRRSETESGVFVIVEEMPELVGGLEALQQRVQYPEIARKARIEGRVIVQFTVAEDGRVVDPVVVRGIGGGCDEEAKRIVSEARFTPGRQRGEAVKVKMSLPVTFDLEGGEDLSPRIRMRELPPPPPPGDAGVRESPPPPTRRSDTITMREQRKIDVYTDAVDIDRPWVTVAHGGPLDATSLEHKVEQAVAIARMNEADAVIVGTAGRAPDMGEQWPREMAELRPGQWVVIRYLD